MILSAYVNGIGILGPGLADWQQTCAVLAGRIPYVVSRTIVPVPTLLPAAERRRTGRVVRLALAVALEASTRADTSPALLRSVFASSGGEGDNCHELCQALARQSREISPIRFTNSVHNAAAGYWGIATGAKLQSSVLCAYDGSFCAGLLETMTHVTVDGQPMLLVAYDAEYPAPLHAKRPLPDAFGVALVITPHRSPRSLARLALSLDNAAADAMIEPAFEAMRLAIPAARCLPLLQLLASGIAGKTVLEYLDVSRVALQVEPCA